MNHRFHTLFLPAVFGLALSGLLVSPGQGRAQEVPTSIIFLVSDGAGAAHWTLGALHDEDQAVARMKTVGLVDTRGSDHVVSGSAPTASAYATGVRTFMGAISVAPDSTPVPTVAEAAMTRGMSTGLMTTTYLPDATPAAFGAHAPSRAALGDIARQMVNNGVTVLMGGGRSYFRPDAQPDGADLLARARLMYTYVEESAALADLDTDTVDTLLGLFAESGMGTVAERGEGTLALMASTALEILGRNPNGFFLLVENEESDTESHRNADRGTLVAEMLDFDEVVEVALDYQARHPGTLVLVTGDHETGGMTLTLGSGPERPAVMEWSTTGHTGTMLPLFASGPGEERFRGIIGNDEVGRILLEMVRARAP